MALAQIYVFYLLLVLKIISIIELISSLVVTVVLLQIYVSDLLSISSVNIFIMVNNFKFLKNLQKSMTELGLVRVKHEK